MDEQTAAMEAFCAMDGRPQSYHIVTYGCQMNAHDSETLSGMLSRMGLREAEDRRQADLVIFNTCCVRENAERRALGNVIWLKQLKTENPGLIIAVCGCMIQQPHMADRIFQQYPFIDLAFGTHNLYRLPSMLSELVRSKRRVISVSPEEDLIAEGLPVKRLSGHKAYVTIMYGCDNFCTYCVVPYVRGRERSRRMEDILAEAEALQKGGVQEIMLLGQNVNSYGVGGDFPKLLKALDEVGMNVVAGRGGNVARRVRVARNQSRKQAQTQRMIAIRLAHGRDLGRRALLHTLRVHKHDGIVASKLFQFAIKHTRERIARAVFQIAHHQARCNEHLGARLPCGNVADESRGYRVYARPRLAR